jgi:hypothetical protein
MESSPSEKYLSGKFEHSELIIGLVSAVETETSRVITPLRDRLARFGYTVVVIKLSSLLPQPDSSGGEYHRIKELMKAGDDLREKEGNNGILAYGASKLIMQSRPPSARKDDASPSRPFLPSGGLMEPIDASLQRGRQG